MIHGDALFKELEREEASRIDQWAHRSSATTRLTTISVDPHADLKQPRAVALHEPLLSLIARIRLTQQGSRMQLQILRCDVSRQQIEQPQMSAS